MHALIPAAGSGSRLGADQPKQYLALAGQPMLVHTVRALLGCSRLRTVTVVVAPQDARAEACLRDVADPRLRIAPRGADTRAASVRGGLQWLLEQGAGADDWVLVHDAARCCITAQAVDRLIDSCLPDEVGGLLALPLPDTLKRQRPQHAPTRVGSTLPREGLWQAQTPQMFRLGPLLAALLACGDTVTDESSAMEARGASPLLVHGEASNFKVTLAGDLELAQAVLQARAAAARGEARNG